MKLTPELLAQASSALNPVKERQLDLRGKFTENSYCCRAPTAVPGYKIPAIENLGVTKVAYMISLARTLVNPSSVCRTSTMPLTLRITPLSH
jgi:hypothetical protein